MHFRLRTQLILATLIISSALAGVCLLLIRHSVKSELDRQRNEAILSSVRAFDRVERAQQLDLARTAAILSELPTLKALMTSGHAATIQDASTDFWESSGADLLVLATPDARIMAVHAAEAEFPDSAAQRLFSSSLTRHEQTAWWQERNELFRVVIRPIVAGIGTEQRKLGMLAVGQHINAAFAEELAHSSGGQIVLVSGSSTVGSTLDKSGLQEFASDVNFRQSPPQQLQIGSHHFDVSIVDLQTSPNLLIRCYMLLPLDSTDAYLHRLNRTMLLLGIVASLAGAALFSLIARTITGPLETLVRAVRALAEGDSTYSVEARGSNEAVELANAFRRMREQLMSSQKSQLESERMAALGRAAGSISHDLRHHLAALVANAEFLHNADMLDVDREEIYQEIERASGQMTGLLDSLLEIARERKTLMLSQADLRDMIRRAIATVRASPEFHARVIEVISNGPTMGQFDVPKLERAFFNLLLNSCQAVNGIGGRTGVTISSGERTFECRVWDSGPGIPESIRETLFEPFVSVGKNNGTGLGLAIAARIIQDHGGSIHVEETSGTGTTFLVCIPRHHAAMHPGAANAKAS